MLEEKVKDGNVEIYADLSSPPPNGTQQTLNKSNSIDKDYLIGNN